MWSREEVDRDRVIALLQAALDRQPASARRLNDLAAAYLLRAGLGHRPGDLVLALRLADRALRSDRGLREALFNRAFALHSLGLWAEARSAWQELASFDGGDPAAAEYLAALPEASAKETEEATLDLRRRGERLLGEWALRLQAEESDEARITLQEAGAAADKLAGATGDRLLVDAVAAIEQASARGDRRPLQALIDGHAAFSEVRGEKIYSDCVPERLDLAARDLAAAGTPFYGWVQIDRAICAYFAKDFGSTEELLLDVLQRVADPPYFALEGRAHWILGLLRMVQGRFSEANDQFTAAIAIFTQIREEPHVVYLRSQRAKTLEFLGAGDEAWRERLAALLRRGAVRDPERVYTIFEEIAQALRQQGRPHVALYFLGEQMRAAEQAAENGELDLLAYTLLDRATLLGELGRPGDATADLGRAEDLWARLPPRQESRLRLRHELDVEEAQVGRDRDAASYLGAVDGALEFFAGTDDSLGDRVEVLKLYRIRAQLNLRHGAYREAEADLRQGIGEIERQRSGVIEADHRVRFLAQARGLFDEMVRLQLDVLGRPLEALETVEQATNRLLLDVSSVAEAGTGRVPALSEELLGRLVPPGTLLIRYGHLADRLLIWSFLDGRLAYEEREISADEVRELVARYRSGLLGRSSAEELAALGGRVEDLVLPRRLPELGEEQPLLLVPDELLVSLPFAALRKAPDAPYLVERHPLSFSPSLSHLANTSGRQEAWRKLAGSAILFVADPAFPRELFPRLRRLDAARRFAQAQAGLYPGSALLTGVEATPRAVLDALQDRYFVHFGSHGLTDPYQPDRGGLLLAADPGAAVDRDSAMLTPRDLEGRRFEHLDLVVLAACSTALGTYPDSGEVAGLATAFLARGVPRVVTAAWEIDDEDSAAFFDAFYRLLAAGRGVEDALRRAQLELLSASDPGLRRPRAWAGFQLFRGGDSFTSARSGRRALS